MSYRDVEELLAERGVDVDRVTIYRWGAGLHLRVHRPASSARHARGERWIVDERYTVIAGGWTYLYRAVDQHGQVIDVLVSTRPRRRGGTSILHLRTALGALAARGDRRSRTGLPAHLEELEPAAQHVTVQYANNAAEADHGRLTSRLRPMRGLKRMSSARTVSAGQAFVQNLGAAGAMMTR